MDKQQNTIFIRLLFPLLLALPFPFTLMNCARESAPLGGPVDTIEPYAVLEKPMNNSQNINPKKIVVKFNEFIALENIEDNCMISPVMEETPPSKCRWCFWNIRRHCPLMRNACPMRRYCAETCALDMTPY